VFTLGLQSIWTEYGMETRLSECDEISVTELDMHLIGNQYTLRTWVEKLEDVRVFAIEIQQICEKSELETLLALSNEIRV